MSLSLRQIWRWSWVVTGPIALFFVVWLTGFAALYHDFQLRYDMAPHRFSWRFEGENHALRMQRHIKSRLSPLRNPDLPIVNLFIGADELAALDRELPHSGFEYVRGRLFDGDRFLKVKVRYRGDFFYHWAFDKKSLRVRTKKVDRFAGLRTFNLIAPKLAGQVNGFLGYAMAHRLGLLTPQAELVWVYVNGSCRGLHLMLEQITESTLRDAGRMPGDIYSGELVAKDAWIGLDNHLFEQTGLWTKVAINNHFPADARRPLERLCELLRMAPSEALHEELGRLLDIDAFAKLAAMEILLGSYHSGETHNWRLFYDPWKTRFEPVVWDPNAYVGFEQHGETPPVALDPNVSRLHNLLLTNSAFLTARERALREFLTTAQVQAYWAEVQDAVEVAAFAVEEDPLLSPPNEAFVASVVERLPGHVEHLHRTITSEYLEPRYPVRWATLPDGGLRVQVGDRVPVNALELRFEAPMSGSLNARLQIERTGASVTRRLPVSTTDEGSRWRIEVTLHSELQPAPRIEMGVLRVLSKHVKPTSFDIYLEGLPPDAQLVGVDVQRPGGVIESARQEQQLPPTLLDLLYGTGAEEPRPTVRWSGAVELDGTTELDADLWIEPGTRIRMGAGASLIVRGRCTAVGKEDAPIRFERRSPEQAPWGTVALVGDAAAGSSFGHTTFQGGSGLVDAEGMFEYSSSVSIHDVDGVRFEHCRFERGSTVDDLVHAVYAQVDFIECAFVEHAGDALDLDISRATLTGCSFERAHNDGLDLMTSEVVVERCRFLDCGDKGISVGEGSHLLALGCEFERCLIGVQAKDGSQAAIAAGDFMSCGQSLDAYRKNWRYAAGGVVTAWACRFRGSRQAPTADLDSQILIGDALGAVPAPTSPRVRVVTGEVPGLDWLSRLQPGVVQKWLGAVAAGLRDGR
ncbi:MAG: CotH kinase family protein [Planctomycetota bacterium]|nr:CotH kinase family protein [Planctomycetota bacterium]